MMIWNAPRARIEVQAGIEFAFLLEAAEFGEFIAAAQSPRAAADAVAVFEHLDLIAGAAQLVRGDETGIAGTEDEHRSTARRAFEFDRTGIARLGGEAERAHGLVHHGRAGHGANAAEECASGDG